MKLSNFVPWSFEALCASRSLALSIARAPIWDKLHCSEKSTHAIPVLIRDATVFYKLVSDRPSMDEVQWFQTCFEVVCFCAMRAYCA